MIEVEAETMIEAEAETMIEAEAETMIEAGIPVRSTAGTSHSSDALFEYTARKDTKKRQVHARQEYSATAYTHNKKGTCRSLQVPVVVWLRG